MTFHEVRLPDDVERGAQGGPRFNTSILQLSSGREQRNRNWDQSRGEYDIGFGIQSRDDFTRVIDFFYARQGRLIGFRFKDWADFSVDVFQQFGVGDGAQTAFQLTKTYTDAGGSFARDIKKPVFGTASIRVNGVPQTEPADYALDVTTGIVTFVAPPAAAAIIDWTGEFDVPVRFDDDELDVNLQLFDAGSVPSITLVELRL